MPGIADDISNMIADRKKKYGSLNFFDAELWMGRPLDYYAPTSESLTAADVSAFMSSRRVEGALISTTEGVLQSPQDGNRELKEAERFLPVSAYTVWTGLPLFPGEPGDLPAPGSLHPRCRGVRLFPKSHRFPLETWVIGSLAAWMTDVRLPLFLWHVETDFRNLYGLAKAYPSLPIIIESQWQKILYQLRTVYNLMRECPNITLEISNLVLPDAIAWCAHEFGAGRLVYGSFYPMAEPLAAQGMLIDSGLSPEEMQLIAGGNITALIGEVRT